MRLNEELEQRVVERTRELSLAQAQLARVERLTTTGRLAASITHEIAQPISAMVTNASSCLRWLTNPDPNLGEARDAVRRVVENGQRATEVFRGIRSLIQRAEPRMNVLDINDVIEETLVLARGELENQSVVAESPRASENQRGTSADCAEF